MGPDPRHQPQGRLFDLQARLAAHAPAGPGAIVHIGSVTGIMGYTHLAAYCASKGGLHALTRAMAIEYAP